jgi:lysozyme
MQISDLAFQKIKDFEGCRLTAYQDAAGVWTIGYGHTKGVKKGDQITQEEADDSLREDIEVVERQVDALGLPLSQPQLDALVSFVFNIGIEKFKRSTLLRYIREGRSENDIKRQWRQWIYAGSPARTLPGLVRRREWESVRFFSVC